jgi:hypothetical protein
MSIVPNTNTSTWRQVAGVVGHAENNSTTAGATAQLRGVESWAYNTANATIHSIVGVGAYAETDAGTVTNMMGLDIWLGHYTAGTVTNIYGIRIDNVRAHAATNRYGIYINDFSGNAPANDFGIYQLGGSKNYFADNVGIGVTSPSHILQINGQGRATNSAWATSSDRRVKKNVQPMSEGLDTIMRLNPVTFEYIDAYKKGQDGMDGMQRGFIAQEVQPVIPEMVKIIDEKFGDQEIKDFHLLTNSDFVPLLVKAVQDLKHENNDLQKRIEALESRFDGQGQ